MCLEGPEKKVLLEIQTQRKVLLSSFLQYFQKYILSAYCVTDTVQAPVIKDEQDRYGLGQTCVHTWAEPSRVIHALALVLCKETSSSHLEEHIVIKCMLSCYINTRFYIPEPPHTHTCAHAHTHTYSHTKFKPCSRTPQISVHSPTDYGCICIHIRVFVNTSPHTLRSHCAHTINTHRYTCTHTSHAQTQHAQLTIGKK